MHNTHTRHYCMNMHTIQHTHTQSNFQWQCVSCSLLPSLLHPQPMPHTVFTSRYAFCTLHVCTFCNNNDPYAHHYQRIVTILYLNNISIIFHFHLPPFKGGQPQLHSTTPGAARIHVSLRDSHLSINYPTSWQSFFTLNLSRCWRRKL